MKENDDPADEEMDDSDTVGTCDHSAMSIAISAPDNTRPIKVMSTFPHDLLHILAEPTPVRQLGRRHLGRADDAGRVRAGLSAFDGEHAAVAAAAAPFAAAASTPAASSAAAARAAAATTAALVAGCHAVGAH